MDDSIKSRDELSVMRRRIVCPQDSPSARQDSLPQGSTGEGGFAGPQGLEDEAFGQEESWREERLRLRELVEDLENDRRLTAYEIHDGLVQDATGAQMHLDSLLGCGGLPPGPVCEKVSLARTLINRVVVEARHLIDGLRPPVLNELGLVAAIEYLMDDQPADGPLIEFTVRVRFDRLNPLHEGTIYRIVQEAINNVRQHSRSERAEVRLTQIDDRVRIEISDWGVGFDPEAVTKKRLGLRGIRERARLLGGWVRIESTPGTGTRILVELPLAGVPDEVVITNDRSIE